MKLFLIIIGAFICSSRVVRASNEDLVYGYECHEEKCVKVELEESNLQSMFSLSACRMFCGDSIGTLWPKPTGLVKYQPTMVHINSSNIQLNFPNNMNTIKLWEANKERFMELLETKVPNSNVLKKEGRSVTVDVLVDDNSNGIPKLALDTDESYKLKISTNNDVISVSIVASTFFGARHGIETLSQLIVYDDVRREIQMLTDVEISDSPAFPWRGLLLDTGRNFYSVKSIKRTLDGMAMTKMNTFHWHITDSQSFPLELKSQPELSKFGAYSQRKIYTHEDIADVLEYGRVRGIRVMPEFDAPAHVGEGWQHKNMTACFNAQPWSKFCSEPPCGQLDPTVPELYPVLEDIYREMFELFDPDVFHMGGDEVSVYCWNSSERIRNWMLAQDGWGLEDKDFLKLWANFQTEALNRVDRVAKEKLPIALWDSHLTDVPFIDYLDSQRYIIQVWHAGSDSNLQEILKRGFRIIVSNYDALYFDCGGSSWVSDGNNWCSPYIGWQKVYNNNIKNLAGDYSSQVLGAEAALWSEINDESTLDARFWPRASALAERLWTNPDGNWRSAESRMLLHRERLIEVGISAEALQPEWCHQNANQCPD